MSRVAVDLAQDAPISRLDLLGRGDEDPPVLDGITIARMANVEPRSAREDLGEAAAGSRKNRGER